MLFRASLALLALATALVGQTPGRLSLEALYHPTKKVTFVQPMAGRMDWLPDGGLLHTQREGGRTTLLRVDPATGARTPLLASEALQAALVAAGAPADAAKAALAGGAFTWNEGRSAFLVKVGDPRYLVDPRAGSAKALLSGDAEEPAFSPDGRQVAFLRGHDLYRVEVATGRETRLTTGGSEALLNGRLDWVYDEEIYGRGSRRAFWWSPDSRRLAFLQLDVSKVPVFTIMDDRTQPQRAVLNRYPKAGDPNPVARLGQVDLDGQVTWAADPYPGQETLVVQVGWDPAGRLLAAYQDRVQTWLELRRLDGGASTVLIREQGPAWQERLPLPRFLPDGGFLWESGRTGRHHLYRYDRHAKLQGAVTAGDWDVREVLGVDPKGATVFFSATERSPIGLDAYRIGLDGKGLTRLTDRPGTHRVRFNPACTAFLDTWSDVRTPDQLSLHDASGRRLRDLDAAKDQGWSALKLGEARFQQVPTRDGAALEAMLILPVGFDPSKRYPVFHALYGGPGTSMVRNAWQPRDMPWYQFLAQQGYVVWVCDNRSASAKGPASAHGIWKRLGAQELQDQLDSLAWLKAQGWADLDRVCLDGWSYGGFMVTYALTRSTAWKAGIAGAPVTDWTLYDSVYTERYMGLPKDNAAGYEAASVLKAAKDLHGRLLLLHGTLDDNVHPQNSVMLLDAFQKAGKTVDFVLLPGAAHGPRTPDQNWARWQAVWAFLQKSL